MADFPSSLLMTRQELSVATIPDSDTAAWSVPSLTVKAGNSAAAAFSVWASLLPRSARAWPSAPTPDPAEPMASARAATLNHRAMNIALSAAPVSVAIEPTAIVLAVASPAAARVVESINAGSFRANWPSSLAAAANHAGVRRQPAACKAIAQPRSPPRQPALDRADWPSQVASDLLVGAFLEVAEHQRGPKALGKPLDLFVHDLGEVVGGSGWLNCDHVGDFLFAVSTKDGRFPRGRGGAEGNSMQPGAERIAHP